jgi:hypothetical protein
METDNIERIIDNKSEDSNQDQIEDEKSINEEEEESEKAKEEAPQNDNVKTDVPAKDNAQEEDVISREVAAKKPEKEYRFPPMRLLRRGADLWLC